MKTFTKISSSDCISSTIYNFAFLRDISKRSNNINLAENYFRNLVIFCSYFLNTADACTFDSIKKRSYNLNVYCCILLTKQSIH